MPCVCSRTFTYTQNIGVWIGGHPYALEGRKRKRLMQTISLSDIELLDIGNTIQIAGVLWSDGRDRAFVTQVPNHEDLPTDIHLLPLTLAEWEQFLRQTDLLETEILAQDISGKIVKAIYRKSQRQIDTYLQWAAFHRDAYHCRYCYRTGVPLTVDHVDLWEHGGGTFLDNLVSCCRPCNKVRGSLPFPAWLQSSYYQARSAHLPEAWKEKNLAVLADLSRLQTLRVTHMRSR